MERRAFLQRLIGTAAAGLAGGTVWAALVGRAAGAPSVLRPPGALPEADFLGACIRCGLCVTACPYDTLRLADFGERAAAGTPTFTPRRNPCRLCQDIPCTAACPSGALDRGSVSRDGALDVSLARMGVAVVDPGSCLAYWGLRCDACYRACPLLGDAITLDASRNARTGRHAFLRPRVHPDRCTGCGLCEHACVTEEAAIRVLPRDVALGAVGDTYLRGWEPGDERRLEDARVPQVGGPAAEREILDELNRGVGDE